MTRRGRGVEGERGEGAREKSFMVASELGWRAVSVPFDQPAFVVGPPELDQCMAEFLDGAECPDPEQVFLQRPDEAFGAAVAMKGQEAFHPISEGDRASRPWRRGARTKAGEDVAPSQVISFWKSRDMYWLP